MRRNTNIAVIGMADHGKSTWIRTKLRGEPRLLVIDTLGDHTLGKKGRGPWLAPPCYPVTSLADTLAAIERAASDRPTWQYGIPLPPSEEMQKVWCDFLCREAYQTAEQHGAVTLVVEEAGYFTNPNYTPEGLNLIIQYGAHPPVNLVWTARNASEVSRRLTSETDIYILFAVHEPNWLDALRDRLKSEVAERVRILQPGQYIAVNRMGEVIESASLWPATATPTPATL